ncbi:aspartate/glutamate racemase family protein [Thiotrichales bacterium 19S3-7]|nr:aspartate/glutamate racemase family protein [Thiotrichales bacterium 19S3-7]MCF6800756.1 aspartate/glutamate racemase family protein [Thiotrichales bacterium 19S3-11]
MQKIIVVAGTKVDADMGVNLLKTYDFNSIACPISESPYQQTQLQNNPALLFDVVLEKIHLVLHQYKLNQAIIFIYCNSLSIAIDLKKLSQILKLSIISPLDGYLDKIKGLNHIGLLAANTQSAGRIEQFLYKQSASLKYVNGIGCLDLVDDIENNLSCETLIFKHGLILQLEIMAQKGAESVILGCTHFSYFHLQLEKMLIDSQVTIELIEPSLEMLNLLKVKLIQLEII